MKPQPPWLFISTYSVPDVDAGRELVDQPAYHVPVVVGDRLVQQTRASQVLADRQRRQLLARERAVVAAPQQGAQVRQVTLGRRLVHHVNPSLQPQTCRR